VTCRDSGLALGENLVDVGLVALGVRVQLGKAVVKRFAIRGTDADRSTSPLQIHATIKLSTTGPVEFLKKVKTALLSRGNGIRFSITRSGVGIERELTS
jgi:hypothetical protein